ncbi:MAG TPA: hypothetical protein VHT91_22535 [Kofleriaceae bacterium]|nr:hypothetical protein [Kofleriaceae bacterium]
MRSRSRPARPAPGAPTARTPFATTARRALIALAIAAAPALAAAPAAASPLSDALARHADADIAALRPRAAEPAARCTLGAIHARRGDLPRAALYLAGCDHADLPDDIAAAIRDAVRDLRRRLDASRLSSLDVVTEPEGLSAEIDALPGEPFATPATIWLPAGNHVVHVRRGDRQDDRSWSQRVTTEPRKHTVVLIKTGLDARPPPPKTIAIDMTDDPGQELGEQHTGPPPDIKHPPLIQDRYRRIPDPAAGDPIDDPLAAAPAPPDERPLWLGLRLAGGMFDDSATAARTGLAVALTGRYRLTDAVFAAARADWSRRGGRTMTGATDPIDAFGASGGLGATVAGSATGPGLALLAELRADLRLADHRAAAPVPRAGLGIAAGAELALPRTPFTVGLRVEQGLTDLAAGARDRAILAELGVDLR